MPPRKKAVATLDGAPNTEEKPKVKREKKSSKHAVVAVVTPEGIQGIFQPDTRRPLIAHLPIHSNEIIFNEHGVLSYDPNPPPQPEAFNAGEIDPFASEATYEQLAQADSPKEKRGSGTGADTEVDSEEEVKPVQKTSIQTSGTAAVATHIQRKEYGPTQLLVKYAATKDTHTLPATTDLACFWCCETFEGRPCVIPSFINDDVWNVYGNFCMPQCAMAYLLCELLDTHTRWERIALLNRLYSAQTNGRIYPAPSRESLIRFGGPISTEDMRSICESQRIRVDIQLPPMVSILASMDTKPIDFYETPLRNTFASPNQLPSIRHADEPQGLKLRRTKPLKDKESTLDSCFQITIK